MRKKKLHKEYCEIEDCGETNSAVLHHHHIVERTEIGTNNHPSNLAVLCANCHTALHRGQIKIIGVFPATNPQGRILVYIKNGVCNVPGIENVYLEYTSPHMKLHHRNKK